MPTRPKEEKKEINILYNSISNKLLSMDNIIFKTINKKKEQKKNFEYYGVYDKIYMVKLLSFINCNQKKKKNSITLVIC